jgi:hypothetical protein
VNGALAFEPNNRQITMSYFPFPLNDRRTVVYALRSRADAAVHRASSLLHAQLAMRTDRLWLSLVAIPLAIPAVVLAGQPWLWLWLLPPLALLAWWWGSFEWGSLALDVGDLSAGFCS